MTSNDTPPPNDDFFSAAADGQEIDEGAADGPDGHDPNARRNRALLAVLAGLIVIGLAIGGFFLLGRSGNEAQPNPAPTQTAAPSTAAQSPTATPAKKGKCQPWKGQFVPTKLTIADLKVNSPILSLGRDENDAAAAPPKDQPNTTGWFNEGPQAGSDQGKVLLTIHTYRQGGALGNQLLKEWKPGMTMVLSDDKGNEACYITGQTYKFPMTQWGKLDRKIMYDWESTTPQIAIVVCDDFNHEKEEWDARVVLYGDREKA